MIDLFYPPLCRLCRSPAQGALCPSCIEQISLPDAVSRCRHCFAPLDNPLPLCPVCVRAPRLSAPSAYLFERMHAARRLECVLGCGCEEPLRLAAASLLVVLWHKLDWPWPDRILIVPPERCRRELLETAMEFARMMDRPLSDEFCFQWVSPFQWRLERRAEELLENQTLLLIDWAGPQEHLRQAVSALQCSFAKTIHILSIFASDP